MPNQTGTAAAKRSHSRNDAQLARIGPPCGFGKITWSPAMLTQTHMDGDTQMHTRTHACTHTHTHARTRAYESIPCATSSTHTQTHRHTDTDTDTQAHTYTHTRTHTHTHSRTHTHTHMRTSSKCRHVARVFSVPESLSITLRNSANI